MSEGWFGRACGVVFLRCACGCGIVVGFVVVLVVLFRLGFFVGVVYDFIIVLVYGGFVVFCSLLACAFWIVFGGLRLRLSGVGYRGCCGLCFVVACFCWCCCLCVAADLLLLVVGCV